MDEDSQLGESRSGRLRSTEVAQHPSLSPNASSRSGPDSHSMDRFLCHKTLHRVETDHGTTARLMR